MLKVFLVEDEVVVREGIKNNIDWLSHGYDFCGEASDGELAFPMIQKLQPDIVITDIQMPFMDGLALSKLIKKEYPWMEVIILTGYEKFEYAKEGIQIGVAEYLLKPISSEELMKEVDELAIKIKDRIQENEIQKKYSQEMEEITRKERKNLFQYLVSGTKTVQELLELAGKQNLNISALWYNVVLIQLKSMNHAEDEFSKRLLEINEKVETVIDNTRIILFDRNLEGKALLFKADSIEELQRLQTTFITQMEAIFHQYEKIRYFGGVGKPVNRLRELPFSFESASHAFAHHYFVQKSCVMNSGDIEFDNNCYQSVEFDIRNVDPKILNRDRIKEFLRTGVVEETRFFIEEFFKNMGKDAIESYMFRQYIAMDVYFCAAEFIEEIQLQKEEIKAFEVTALTLQNVDSTMRYVTDLIETTIELREKSARSRYHTIVNEVKSYIEKNYAKEDLTLNQTASHVNFSPNHLSTIFSQETGSTFIKYLTDYRMNEAKKLLRCTGKRSNEIGTEVGYRDPHYFSYLFRKTQGMTPTQYRGSRNSEGDIIEG